MMQRQWLLETISHWRTWLWFTVRYQTAKTDFYRFVYQSGEQRFWEVSHWLWGTIESIMNVPIAGRFVLQKQKTKKHTQGFIDIGLTYIPYPFVTSCAMLFLRIIV